MTQDTIPFNFPSDDENEYSVLFEVTSWGRPASGPSFNSPGEPPEAPEYEVLCLYRNGKKVPLSDPDYDLLFTAACEEIDSYDFGRLRLEYEDRLGDYLYERMRDW